jgi:hypothetical protein
MGSVPRFLWLRQADFQNDFSGFAGTIEGRLDRCAVCHATGLCKASGDEKEARENIKEANYRLAGGREAESG